MWLKTNTKECLIYAGGDDVLAILPADKVLPCANKIRKMYSGIGNVELKIDNTTYKFDNGILYKNDIQYKTINVPCNIWYLVYCK